MSAGCSVPCRGGFRNPPSTTTCGCPPDVPFRVGAGLKPAPTATCGCPPDVPFRVGAGSKPALYDDLRTPAGCSVPCRGGFQTRPLRRLADARRMFRSVSGRVSNPPATTTCGCPPDVPFRVGAGFKPARYDDLRMPAGCSVPCRGGFQTRPLRRLADARRMFRSVSGRVRNPPSTATCGCPPDVPFRVGAGFKPARGRFSAEPA